MDFHVSSLYQFSVVDATLAVDYSWDVGIDDGVVNSPPPIVVSHSYTPSPSPLSKEKQTLVWCWHVSPLRDDNVACRELSQRLCMEDPRYDPSSVNSSPPPPNSSMIVIPPCLDSPHYPAMQQFNQLRMLPSMPPRCWSCPTPTPPKPRWPSLSPLCFSPLLSLSCMCMLCTLRAPVPNPPSLISHSILPMVLFRKSLRARLVAGPPRLPCWIGTPQGRIFRVQSLFGPPEKCKTFSLANALVFHLQYHFVQFKITSKYMEEQHIILASQQTQI